MPYRRLPTTDKARLRALNSAAKMAAVKIKAKLAFSQKTLEELAEVKTSFENTLKQHKTDLRIFSDKNKDYKVALEKARIYISHFIQVLFMCVEREEIKVEALEFYGLQDTKMKVPSMNTGSELMEWGTKVIDGDQKRLLKGGSAIYNPSIALVKIKFQEFRDAAFYQQNLKKNLERSKGKMEELRTSTNEFISRLWTEIEENLTSDSPKHKRQLAHDYGIVYVFRRKEKKTLKPDDLQTDLLFDFG